MRSIRKSPSLRKSRSLRKSLRKSRNYRKARKSLRKPRKALRRNSRKGLRKYRKSGRYNRKLREGGRRITLSTGAAQPRQAHREWLDTKEKNVRDLMEELKNSETDTNIYEQTGKTRDEFKKYFIVKIQGKGSIPLSAESSNDKFSLMSILQGEPGYVQNLTEVYQHYTNQKLHDGILLQKNISNLRKEVQDLITKIPEAKAKDILFVWDGDNYQDGNYIHEESKAPKDMSPFTILIKDLIALNNNNYHFGIFKKGDGPSEKAVKSWLEGANVVNFKERFKLYNTKNPEKEVTQEIADMIIDVGNISENFNVSGLEDIELVFDGYLSPKGNPCKKDRWCGDPEDLNRLDKKDIDKEPISRGRSFEYDENGTARSASYRPKISEKMLINVYKTLGLEPTVNPNFKIIQSRFVIATGGKEYSALIKDTRFKKNDMSTTFDEQNYNRPKSIGVPGITIFNRNVK